MKYFDLHTDVIKWSSEETVIKYISPIDNKPHRYFIDFMVQYKKTDGKIETAIIEVKPEKQTKPPAPPKRKTKWFIKEVMEWEKNKAKWAAANKYAEEKGIEFKILTERHIL